MADVLISVSGLSKLYRMGQNVVHALDGVSVEIQKTGFLAILGPSGSGKSTLLHLIGGLDRPTSGSIRVAGEQLERMDENALALYRRTWVGMIFQSFNLIPSMSALENVIFPLRFNGVARTERRERAAAALEQVGLSERASHKPTELSGGQQQRVAIARALINNPPILLADEPTGNLDTSSGGQVMELLASLQSQGRTVLVVSHDPRVSHFADQTLFLLDGRVVSEAEYNLMPSIASTE
jgi:putative ABC transport system ATP-binding protein